RADEAARAALLGAAAEVALRLADDHVVADLGRRVAVEVGGTGRGRARRVAVDAEDLRVRIARSRVPVAEDDLQVAVRQRHGVRALVEVAVVRRAAVEEVAEKAEARVVAADLLRGRPRQAPLL